MNINKSKAAAAKLSESTQEASETIVEETKETTINPKSADIAVDDMLFELPPLISGKVIEMSGGGMNAHGHAGDCDFLGHLPPAASYQLVELDLKTS